MATNSNFQTKSTNLNRSTKTNGNSYKKSFLSHAKAVDKAMLSALGTLAASQTQGSDRRDQRKNAPINTGRAVPQGKRQPQAIFKHVLGTEKPSQQNGTEVEICSCQILDSNNMSMLQQFTKNGNSCRWLYRSRNICFISHKLWTPPCTGKQNNTSQH